MFVFLVLLLVITIPLILFGAFRLAVLLGGRGYTSPEPPALVRVHPQDLPSREVSIDGVFNMRDLGSIPCGPGKQLRNGLVYRSANWSQLTSEGAQGAETLGIKALIDLRSSLETQELPNKLASSMEQYQLPLFNKRRGFEGMFRDLLFRRRKLGETIAKGYIDTLEKGKGAFTKVFSHMSRIENLPLCFHCTAGKDRTGLVAMLLLDLLGVSKEHIVADYSLSNLAVGSLFHTISNQFGMLKRLGLGHNDILPLLVVDPEWIELAYDHMYRNYGDAEGYLLDAGVAPWQIESIRTILVETC